MILNRHALALLALCSGLAVGACAQFSNTVTDAWPHWAGGEPANTPPRPGSPGYQDYIAHRQAETGTEPQQTPAAAGSAAAPPAPAIAANPPPAPEPSAPPAESNAIARGNLY